MVAMSSRQTVAELFRAATDGDERALGRVLSLVESNRSTLQTLWKEVSARLPDAGVIGITGPPGVGKSTLVSALIGAFRDAGLRVAVVAIDPSSPFTGGALLGDRIRMQPHALDPAVFIRSMSSRGHLGGLASTTPDVIDVLARVGFDLVLVETVGVGQAEVEIATYADSVIVVSAAGGGDAVQAAKAGILEIADVYVVNKADLPGTGDLATDLRQMLGLGELEHGFSPNVLEVVARDGTGVEALVKELGRHRQWLEESSELDLRRRSRVERRLEVLAREHFAERLKTIEEGRAFSDAVDRVINGRIDVHSAALELVDHLGR